MLSGVLLVTSLNRSGGADEDGNNNNDGGDGAMASSSVYVRVLCNIAMISSVDNVRLLLLLLFGSDGEGGEIPFELLLG